MGSNQKSVAKNCDNLDSIPSSSCFCCVLKNNHLCYFSVLVIKEEGKPWMLYLALFELNKNVA